MSTKDYVIYVPKYDMILISHLEGLWFEGDPKTPKKIRPFVEKEIQKGKYRVIGEF